MKKMEFQHWFALLMAAMMLLSVTGCGGNKEKDSTPQKELYISVDKGGKKTVVDKDGKALTEFAFDKDGNITDHDGNIVVATDEVKALPKPPAKLDGKAVYVTTDKEGKKQIVDDAGKPVEGYTVDESGNIADESGKTVVESTDVTAPPKEETSKPNKPSKPNEEENKDKNESGDNSTPSKPTPAKPTPNKPSHTHRYTSSTVAPTCTSDGYIVYTCSCGDTYTSDYVSALGHNYGSWSTVKEPTYDSEGKQQRTCSRCGKVESKSIPCKEWPHYDCEEAMRVGNEYALTMFEGIDYSLTWDTGSYYPYGDMTGTEATKYGGQAYLNECIKEEIASVYRRLCVIHGEEYAKRWDVRCWVEYDSDTDMYTYVIFY